MVREFAIEATLDFRAIRAAQHTLLIFEADCVPRHSLDRPEFEDPPYIISKIRCILNPGGPADPLNTPQLWNILRACLFSRFVSFWHWSRIYVGYVVERKYLEQKDVWNPGKKYLADVKERLIGDLDVVIEDLRMRMER